MTLIKNILFKKGYFSAFYTYKLKIGSLLQEKLEFRNQKDLYEDLTDTEKETAEKVSKYKLLKIYYRLIKY